MAGTTAAFGWTYPTSTDLVKDGAAAIETLADGIDLSLMRHGCVITNTANLSITQNTSTAITMNTEILDTDAFHSTVTNTSRITIPTGYAGVYSAFAYCRWDGVNTVTNPIVIITLNGTAVTRSQVLGANTFTPTSTAWTGYCAVGDYIEMRVYHSIAAARNVEYVSAAASNNLDPRSPVLGAFRLGGPA